MDKMTISWASCIFEQPGDDRVSGLHSSRGPRRAGRLRCAAGVLVLLLLPSAPASALTAAERYAQRAGEEAMAIARAGGASAGIAARFQASMRRHADIPRLAAFALGPYRRDLPPSRRREFHRLVERFAGQVFASYHADFV